MEEYIFNTFLKVLYYHNSEKKHRAIRDCRQTSAVNRCINIANYRCSLMLEPRQAKARCLKTRMTTPHKVSYEKDAVKVAKYRIWPQLKKKCLKK